MSTDYQHQYHQTAWCSSFILHDEPLLQAALDDIHIWRTRHALLEAFSILYYTRQVHDCMHKDKLPDGKKFRKKKDRSAGNYEIKLDTLYRAGRATLQFTRTYAS